MDFKELKESDNIVKVEVEDGPLDSGKIVKVERKVFNPDTGEESGTTFDLYAKSALEEQKNAAQAKIANINELLKEFDK